MDMFFPDVHDRPGKLMVEPMPAMTYFGRWCVSEPEQAGSGDQEP